MAITAWSPLAGGLLSGKFNAGGDPADREGARLSTSAFGDRTLTPANLEAAAGLSAVATELGCSPAQLALAWLLHRRPLAVVPIIGARTLAQLEDNLAATRVTLDAETVAALDALKPPAPAYPNSLLDSPFFRSMMFAGHHADFPPRH
jgi:aryl-alcohol dehydrogenase-like predicted oxidoreductase